LRLNFSLYLILYKYNEVLVLFNNIFRIEIRDNAI